VVLGNWTWYGKIETAKQLWKKRRAGKCPP
jgi:hypothetical protein